LRGCATPKAAGPRRASRLPNLEPEEELEEELGMGGLVTGSVYSSLLCVAAMRRSYTVTLSELYDVFIIQNNLWVQRRQPQGDWSWQ